MKNTIPQLETSKLNIDAVLYGFYSIENYSIKINYLHPEKGLINFIEIDNIKSFFKHLKNIFNYQFNVEITTIENSEYLKAKTDVASDLYAEGKITRPECLKHEIDYLICENSGAIKLL